MSGDNPEGNGASRLKIADEMNPAKSGLPATLLHVTSLKDRLDVTSRLGAMLVVLLYVCGFLVVSFQNASHGIVTFGFFRARVLAAGVLFSFFTSLALLDWARFFSGQGRPKQEDSEAFGGTLGEFFHSFLPKAAGEWLYSFLRKTFWFVAAALALTFILSPLVFHEFGGLALVLLVCFSAVGAAMTIPSKASKHPAVSTLIHASILVGAVAAIVTLKDWNVLLMLGWFATVGIAADFIRSEALGKNLRDLQAIRDIRWAWIVVFVVGVCSYFGGELYPRIQPTLGGGQPSKAVFQFAGRSPIDGLVKDQLWLLDEEDTGYYVLQRAEDHKAAFIPRSLVSAIYFDEEQAETPAGAATTKQTK
jgi:hypothetical protein